MPISLTESMWIILSFMSGSLIIGIIMLVLYRYQKIPYLRSWALFWLVIFSAYLNLYFFSMNGNTYLLSTYYNLVIISGMVFMYATHRFLTMSIPKWLIITDLVLYVVSLAIGFSNSHINIKLYAVFGLFGWYIIVSGFFFLWKEGKKAWFTVVMIILLGLMNLLFPFTYQIEFFSLYGYVIMSMFGTGAGVGILGMHFMRFYRKEEELKEKLRYLSYHDDLTPLNNRAFLNDKIHEIDQNQNMPIALVLSDLNELKVINDHYGHRMGDELIQKTADILLAHSLRQDMVVRYGGDEFVCIMFKTTEEAVQTYINVVQADCLNTLIEGRPISLAMGYAIKTDTTVSLIDLFDTAEKHMYEVKKQQRQTIASINNQL